MKINYTYLFALLLMNVVMLILEQFCFRTSYPLSWFLMLLIHAIILIKFPYKKITQ